MPTQLPAFVLSILPPLYVAFTRVIERLNITAGGLLCLFLLRSSPVTIEGRKVAILTELLDQIRNSMGYFKQSAASDLVSTLCDAGLIQKASITEEQRGDYFPSAKRTAAVFLTEEGEALFQQFKAAIRDAAGTFLDQLDENARKQFAELFIAAQAYESLVPALEAEFLNVPSGEHRFKTACQSYLGSKATADDRAAIDQWYETQIAALPPGKMVDFLSELERSVAATPDGLQRRRAETGKNSAVGKLIDFLDKLVQKHQDGNGS